MSLRKKIFIGIAVASLLLILWPTVAHYRAKARLAAHRQKLIAQGEKLTYHELTPRGSSEPNQAREFDQAARRLQPDWPDPPSLAKEIAPGVARVLWQEDEPFEASARRKGKTNVWPVLREMLATNSVPLSEIKAALQGPAFHVTLDYQQGFGLMLPHLSYLSRAAPWLTAEMLVALRAGDSGKAFECLQACESLPRAFTPEPLWVSQLVRIRCAHTAFHTTWEALQFDGWTDNQLADLQQHWQRIDFLEPMEPVFAMERVMQKGVSQRY